MLVMHAGDQFRQDIGRVSDHTAKDAGMEIGIGAVNSQFKIGQAAQGIDDGGLGG